MRAVMTSNFCPKLGAVGTLRFAELRGARRGGESSPGTSTGVHVETHSGMAEKLGNVEKIACAAAEIENALGTRQDRVRAREFAGC